MRLLVCCFAILVLIDASLCASSTTVKSESEVATATTVPEEQPNDVEAIQLSDVADAGAQHANEADRNARLIGLGIIGFGGGYGYRPWGGYGYGGYYRPWGGYGHYYRPWGGYGGYGGYHHHYHGGWGYYG